MCVFLYDVKVNLNHSIRLQTRMSFFLRSPLFLCYGNVNLNYCVGIKAKRPKNLPETFLCNRIIITLTLETYLEPSETSTKELLLKLTT